MIETAAGKGCFLRNHQKFSLKKEARLEMLRREIDQAAIEAHHLQIGLDEFLKLSRERFNLLSEQRAKAETV